MSKFDEALHQALKELNLQPSITIERIEKANRVMLKYTQDPDYPKFSDNMIKLERRMKEIMGIKLLDLRLPDRDDKNKREERTDRK